MGAAEPGNERYSGDEVRKGRAGTKGWDTDSKVHYRPS